MEATEVKGIIDVIWVIFIIRGIVLTRGIRVGVPLGGVADVMRGLCG